LQVRAKFRPEFINRIDEFVIFEGLNKEQIRRIVRIQADRVAERLAARKVKMVLEDSAVDYLGVRIYFVRLNWTY
jgi:ATP-dependent Clp protease ATP-binding subunit ClpB